MPVTYEPNVPVTVEGEDLKKTVSWVYEELTRVAAAFQAQADISLLATNVAPLKPVVGELRWADGTNWNPGGGLGVYEYTALGVNGWRQLANGTQY